jgi:hypothetical protein
MDEGKERVEIEISNSLQIDRAERDISAHLDGF